MNYVAFLRAIIRMAGTDLKTMSVFSGNLAEKIRKVPADARNLTTIAKIVAKSK
jgi:hypothetical protein